MKTARVAIWIDEKGVLELAAVRIEGNAVLEVRTYGQPGTHYEYRPNSPMLVVDETLESR